MNEWMKWNEMTLNEINEMKWMKWNEMTWNEMKWNEWMNKWNEMNEWKNIEGRKEGKKWMNDWMTD